MDKRLYEAAAQGSLDSLLNLLKDDPLLLDRCIVGHYVETPLHIAAMLGHVEFVREILSRKPELAFELDSQGSAPLHLAAAKGFLNSVKSLLAANPEMCFSKDKFGRNPIHVSAIKGRIDVLKEMIAVRPGAALQRMSNKDTILHLCVKNNRLNSMKVLLMAINDHGLVNSKNYDGDTVLHLAATDKQSETISFLINNTEIDMTVTNQRGLTALDILAQSGVEKSQAPINYSLSRNEIELEAADHPLQGRRRQINKKQREDWLERMSSALMIVAILTATMAFQVGVNPPGGVWQDTSQGDEHSGPHVAGFSILADNYPSSYSRFLAYNTVTFIASLSIILLLISGLPLRRRLFVWILMVIMWVAITANALTYIISISAFTPDHEKKNVVNVIYVVILVWTLLMLLLLIVHTVRLVVRLVRKMLRKWNKRSSSVISDPACV